MVLFLYSSRVCRHVSCLTGPRLTAAVYSNLATSRVKRPSPSREPPCLTISDKPSVQILLQKTIIPSDLADLTERTVPSQGHITQCKQAERVRQEQEWRLMEADVGKLQKHCLMLSKMRLTSLVVITTMGGYALAPGAFDPYTFLACSVGTGLVSATANAINQFFEVPFDAQMSRTKNRVLVRGHLTPAHAIIFAAVAGVTGLSILYTQVNGLTASLGAINLLLYTLVYTPMKRVSILNTWVGSVVGAIPPLMGWAGCVGDIISPGAWIMSGILYAWQFPHFNALSWNLRPDYSRAGYRMMAVTNPDLCRKTALRYTAILTGLCYLAPILDVTSWWFALMSTPLNAYFLYLAWRFHKQSDSGSSRKLFRFSLAHLPVLMVLLLVNKKYWFGETKQTGSVVRDEKHQKTDALSFLTRFIASPSSV